MIIYKATNKLNQKVYIGLTSLTLAARMTAHYWQARSSSKNYHFYNAIRKYGWEVFKWEVIDRAENYENLIQLEIEYIKKYDSFNNGYNSTLGGEGTKGIDHKGSKNSRAIISEEDALLIVDLLIENEKTITEIAAMFNVDPGIVKNINRGKTWTHLYELSPIEQGRKKMHANVAGEKNSNTDLTDAIVYDMKKMLTEGATRVEVENKYGVSPQLLQRIIRGVHWAHVVYEGFCVKAEEEEKKEREKEVKKIRELMAEGLSNQEVNALFDNKFAKGFLVEVRNFKTFKHVTIDREIPKSYLKLVEDDAKEIKKLLYLGMKQEEIAQKYNVDRATIASINTGKIWAHVVIDTSDLVKDSLKKPKKHIARKLNAEKAREIKTLIRDGVGNQEIAKMYGVNPNTISKIRTGKIWADIAI